MNLSTIRKHHVATACALAIVAILAYAVLSIPQAHANPSSFLRKQPATASTSPTYMTPGTATTTFAFDTAQGNNFAPDSAVFLAQQTASSTGNLAFFIEYSQDGADWYQSNVGTQGTTTAVQNITTPFSYLWTFASTTPGGGAPAGNRQNKAIEVKTPTRFVRIVFYIPAGTTNSAIWGEWVAKKEVQ